MKQVDYIDVTNRIEKEPSKKYSLSILIIGKKSIFAFRNRLEDVKIFFQNFSNIEIIYIDLSEVSVEDFSEVLDIARIVIPNREISFSEAVNIGMKIAKANLVVVLPVNYRLSSFHIREITQVFESEPTLLCITPQILYQGKRIANIVKFGIVGGVIEWMVLNDSKNMSNLTPNSFLGVFNRKLFNSIGGYATDLPEVISEIEFGIRTWTSGCIILSSKSFLVDKLAEFDIPINISNFPQPNNSFKYLLSKKPSISILKDLLLLPVKFITFRFRDISEFFSRLKVYFLYRNKTVFYTPEIEKISYVINYKHEI